MLDLSLKVASGIRSFFGRNFFERCIGDHYYPSGRGKRKIINFARNIIVFDPGIPVLNNNVKHGML